MKYPRFILIFRLKSHTTIAIKHRAPERSDRKSRLSTPLPTDGTVLFSFESTTGPVGLSASFWTFKTGNMVSATGTTAIVASIDPIPEPGSMALLGIGVVGLFTWRRLCRRKAEA